jgi:ATP-dependent Clp protease protease subunit
MKFWNLNLKRGADGSKHLDIQIHGVIDGGWLDEGVNTSEIIAELQQHLDAKTIGVRINSVGGSAFGGIALYNALKSHPAKVTATVEGLAASAASLVALAGETVMGRGSMMMIHPPLTIAMGNAAELRKTADVLDKVQAGLAAIYVEKTGKPLDEINAMISAETWMTADDAIAAGFANGIGGAPEAVEVGAAEEPEEGDEKPEEEEEAAAPVLTADAVVWNGVTFPIKALPQQQVVLAMAKPQAAPPVRAATAAAPPPALEKITRDTIAAKAPEILAALLAEGHAKGAAEERARLQAIDDLPVRGHAQLVASAKYGAEPKTAEQVAVAILKAEGEIGASRLEARRTESKDAAGIRQSAPEKTTEASEREASKNIAELANRRRGGSR